MKTEKQIAASAAEFAEIMMDRPTFITDPTYKQWVNDIERRFRSQQIKAVVQINSCKIEFYWSIGRNICEMNVEQRYGDGVIKTLSQDLRMKIPEVKGLTPGGLYYCKRFYLLYNNNSSLKRKGL